MKKIAINQIIHSKGRDNKLQSDDVKIRESAEALRHNISIHGIIDAIALTPITTGPDMGKYLCVSGNQRLWCLESLGYTDVEKYTIMSDVSCIDSQGIEASANYFRIPETKREYADRVKIAMSAGKTIDQIAREWGIDRRTIETWAGVNTLPEPIREKVVTGALGLTAVDKVAKAGKKLSAEEKENLLVSFTKDTTAEQAAAIVAAKVAEKKTKDLLSVIGAPSVVANVPEVKPVLSVARSEAIYATVKALREAGRDDAPFVLVGMVMDYIFQQSKDNPFQVE